MNISESIHINIELTKAETNTLVDLARQILYECNKPGFNALRLEPDKETLLEKLVEKLEDNGD